MQYNKNPISLREGHAFIDGVEVMDDVKMNCLLYTSPSPRDRG